MLDFDFDAALEKYKREMEEHAKTVGVPAPTAHQFVEGAYRAGGYEVVESNCCVKINFTELPEEAVLKNSSFDS